MTLMRELHAPFIGKKFVFSDELTGVESQDDLLYVLDIVSWNVLQRLNNGRICRGNLCKVVAARIHLTDCIR